MPAAKNSIHELFAYLCVHDAQKAIDFYTRAFGAVELFRLTEPSGRIGHAELQMGPSAVLMLNDPFPEFGIVPPPPEGIPGSRIHLHVDNCDDMLRQAVARAPPCSANPPTSSTASAAARCSTPSATPGCSAIRSRSSRPKKCSAAIPSC
jgi:PhnB protein